VGVAIGVGGIVERCSAFGAGIETVVGKGVGGTGVDFGLLVGVGVGAMAVGDIAPVVAICVAAGIALSVAIGVAVSVALAVATDVAVGVALAVAVGIVVGVALAVAVGVAVELDEFSLPVVGLAS